jgi:hypothetical protein
MRGGATEVYKFHGTSQDGSHTSDGYGDEKNKIYIPKSGEIRTKTRAKCKRLT